MVTACGANTGPSDPSDSATTSGDSSTAGSTDNDAEDVKFGDPELAELGVVMCGLYERCNLPPRYTYGIGDECVQVFSALVGQVLDQRPEFKPSYAQLHTCAEITTRSCPEPGSSSESRWLERIMFDCLAPTFAHEGESCDESMCGFGLRCSSATKNSCGECEISPKGWCSLDAECADKEYCDEEINKCTALAKLDEPCAESQECLVGNCIEDVCVMEAELGETCTAGSECKLSLDCVDGTCQAPAGKGEDCSSAECRLAFGCVDDVCEPIETKAPLGAHCGLVLGCAEGAYCDYRDNICKSNAVGQECEWVCGSDRVCLDGACAPLFSEGDSCESDFDCASGRCFEGACAPKLRCREP